MGEAMQEALYAVCVPLLRRLGGRRGAVALDDVAMVADQRALRRCDTCSARLLILTVVHAWHAGSGRPPSSGVAVKNCLATYARPAPIHLLTLALLLMCKGRGAGCVARRCRSPAAC